MACALLATLVCARSPLAAQERHYLAEVGAAGVYQSFDGAAELKGALGGMGRLGLWLPLNLSVEVDGAFTKPKAESTDEGVSVRQFSGALLYNVPVGGNSWIYLKAGGGSTKYGSDCPAVATTVICGSSGALLGGAGFRAGLTPGLLLRGEALISRNKSDRPAPLGAITLTNFGLNLGLSVMPGSKPIPDSDRDGVLDNRDRCPGTPVGAQVDGRGCSGDSDSDGVPDGLDRCPATPPGATVDPRGCTTDSDGDNIPDGIDRCPDTQAGVLVDPTGCARDSDGDSIPDGLDRCSDTPRGATVDALGCPGDEDADGVLDGLDRCPRSPAGATVNTMGCAAGQSPVSPGAAPVPAPSAQPPSPAPSPAPRAPQPAQPRPIAQPAQAPPPAGKILAGVIPGVSFEEGTARLRPGSYVPLDSIADVLMADTTIRVEIAAHTDNSTPPAAAQHLTNLQAEAVRTYLVTKGVRFQQVVPQGYGATVPLTPDNTPRGRLANRRVEIRPAAPGP